MSPFALLSCMFYSHKPFLFLIKQLACSFARKIVPHFGSLLKSVLSGTVCLRPACASVSKRQREAISNVFPFPPPHQEPNKGGFWAGDRPPARWKVLEFGDRWNEVDIGESKTERPWGRGRVGQAQKGVRVSNRGGHQILVPFPDPILQCGSMQTLASIFATANLSRTPSQFRGLPRGDLCNYHAADAAIAILVSLHQPEAGRNRVGLWVIYAWFISVWFQS